VRRLRLVNALLPPLLVAATAACGSSPQPTPRDLQDANDFGRSVPPSGTREERILRTAGSLGGEPVLIEGAAITAEPAYTAASGRTCRPLHITLASRQVQHRLVCDGEKGWTFVPDVFGSHPYFDERCATCTRP
jgi:hypothetical protein